MESRKRLVGVGALLLFIGLLGLMTASRRPEFESIRVVDVVQLIGCGMCFGVALCALFGLLRGTRAS
jgi:hypothetical protein